MDFKPKNSEDTPTHEIVEQLKELRPLPLGRQQFEDFFERIWSGALITAEPGHEELLKLSVKSLVSDEIVHLPGHQTHETDIHFINRARKLCSNQVALTIKGETHTKINAILKDKKEKEDKLKLISSDGKIVT